MTKTFYKLSIKTITRETPQAISVVFLIPENLQEKYTFLAGQYVTLKLTLDGQEIRRVYSICSSPKSNELRIAIKAIENGFFSVFANEKLTEDNTLEVGMPEGNFIFKPNSNTQQNYLGFAAGSGITPIFSIIKSVLEEEPKSTFVLVYGNKTEKTTIFYNQLQKLQQQYPNNFFAYYIFSEENSTPHLFGRINATTVNYIIKDKHKNIKFASYYLCGPEEMVNDVKNHLKTEGEKEEKIKFELFTTSISKDTTIEENTFENSTATIVLDDEETTLNIKKEQTILEAVLQHKLDAPYSCQGGVCSSCIALITNGKAVMKKNTVLTDAEIEEGFVLTCQSVATTASITVNYDEV